MRKYALILMTIILALIISACGSENSNTKEEDIKEIVHNYTIGNFDEKVSASINSHQLIVNEDGEETVYDLPEDEFFVSIAPFMTSTHECAIHSLTTCQGELVEETFDVMIETEDGEVIVDEQMKTFQNGFIDLWLPRNETLTVTIKQGNRVAVEQISTYKGDNTCITTMQLVANNL